MDIKKKETIERIDTSIASLKNKDFTLFFFVIDSKNVPNGTMQYVYDLAKELYDKKYNVKMVYQLENEYTKHDISRLKRLEKPIDYTRVFEGVGEWLGEDYMKIPHMNISNEEWKVSPQDYLFIPESLSSLMKQTYQFKATCKRVVLLHNFDYVTEFIPFGDEWGTYGIYDCIATTNRQKELIESVFPYIRTHIIQPKISNEFRPPVEPKKLIVNIISKKTEDVNSIIKQFYWKYPELKFVTFRDIRGYSKTKMAEYMKESAITVWIDSDTPFGYSVLEAMKCDNVIIAKMPNEAPDWSGGKTDISDCALWTFNIHDIPELLSKVLISWMTDSIPDTFKEARDKVNRLFTEENYSDNVDKVFTQLINDRVNEFNDVKNAVMQIKENDKTTEEDEHIQ